MPRTRSTPGSQEMLQKCGPVFTPFPPGPVHRYTRTLGADRSLPVLTASPAAGLCPHLVACPAQSPHSPSTAGKGNWFSGHSEAAWLLLSLPWVTTCKQKTQAELNSFDDECQGGRQACPLSRTSALLHTLLTTGCSQVTPQLFTHLLPHSGMSTRAQPRPFRD